jgi:hypothetical protein
MAVDLGRRRLFVAELGNNTVDVIDLPSGKTGDGSSAAAVALDLYIIRDSNPLVCRDDDLTRVIEARMLLRRPLIVEGICLCRVLQSIDRKPDFLVWVDNKSGPTTTRFDPPRLISRNLNPNGTRTSDWCGRGFSLLEPAA